MLRGRAGEAREFHTRGEARARRTSPSARSTSEAACLRPTGRASPAPPTFPRGLGAAQQHHREPGRQVHADRRERKVPLCRVDHIGIADSQRKEVRRDEIRLRRRGLSQPPRLCPAKARISRRGDPRRELLSPQGGPLQEGYATHSTYSLPPAGRSWEAPSLASSSSSGTSGHTRSS